MTTENPLIELKTLGQRIWLDNLSRTLIRDGILKRLIEEDGLAGVTSNPTIFYRAISESPYYRDDLAHARADRSLTPEQCYERLAIPDIQAACDLFRPVFTASGGEDGYVSLEVSPALAHDTQGTVAAARRLRAAVRRDNLLVKVPATSAGVTAITKLIAEGCSVNVTLMFSLEHVASVADAYIRGLSDFAAHGGDVRRVKSVASLFLSRVDTLVDRRLEAAGGAALDRRGRSGVALAKLAYQEYQRIFAGVSFSGLRSRGARPQHLLWASTGTKNPAYSDVLYVEPLIGPETVNTLPDATLAAFRDHGRAAMTLADGLDEARRQFTLLGASGIDMGAVGEELQEDGVRQFAQSFDQLLALMAAPHTQTA